jgi:hypothetical protein
MIQWMYFPHATPIPEIGLKLVEVFKSKATSIASASNALASNEVLAVVSELLALEGFAVELGKKKAEKLPVPVLFGLNGRVMKSFDADAHHKTEGFVLEN